jgi:mannitol 2-dehydrogenase
LAQTKYYGDLAQNSRFEKAFSFWLKMIWEEGTETAISSYLVD